MNVMIVNILLIMQVIKCVIKEFLNKKFNDYPEKEYTTS